MSIVENIITKVINDDDREYCISFNDVLDAVGRIQAKVELTPVLTRSIRGQEHQFYFKVEAFQTTGSFKLRGATNAVQALVNDSKEDRQHSRHENAPAATRKVIAHSSGNHALALAHAAAQESSSIQATLVMPVSASLAKKRKVQSIVCETASSQNPLQVVLVQDHERESKVNEIMHQTTSPIHLIHPSENPYVIAGQGTVGYEFYHQLREKEITLDILIIPVGGGGLAAGNCISMAQLSPRTKIILAEPQTLNDAQRSFQQQALQTKHERYPVQSVADGLKTTLGPNTWPILRDHVDRVLTVTEDEILRATKYVWDEWKVCIEPSAGVGVAVAMSEDFGSLYPPDKFAHVGIILCGGNVDIPSTVSLMKERGIYDT